MASYLGKAGLPSGFPASLAREPLVHFALIGLAVFLGHAIVSDARPAVPADRQEIVLTQQHLDRLSVQFEAVWRRAPTPADLAALRKEFVREEVYYREALAFGLDRDDAVVRQRLRQKMEFLTEGGEVPAPAEAVLRAYFAEHRERFAAATRVTFRQVFFASPAAAAAALASGSDPATVGQTTLMPPFIENTDETGVDAVFGGGFFRQVSALKPGVWQGPIASAYGAHLVWPVEIRAAEAPPFEAVRGIVEEEWRREAAEAAREAQYRALRARYTVVLP